MYSVNLGSWVEHTACCIIVFSAFISTACTGVRTSSPLTLDQSVATTNSVRAFAATVADDVTRRGPAAWRAQFADTPAFFMASEGHLVFANSDAATRGIQELTGSIAHIELRWGEPMLVDPLTPTLAMLGAPYHEVRVDTAGQSRGDWLFHWAGGAWSSRLEVPKCPLVRRQLAFTRALRSLLNEHAKLADDFSHGWAFRFASAHFPRTREVRS